MGFNSETLSHPRTHRLEFTQEIPRRRAEVFQFFSSEKNLEELTPPWVYFHVIGKNTPTITNGTRIDYRLKIHGMPIRWQSEIAEWAPPDRFVDWQVRGPYRLWYHRHEFADLPNGGTLMTDRVWYRAPFGVVGDWMLNRLIRSDVMKIFSYRRVTIERLFGKSGDIQ